MLDDLREYQRAKKEYEAEKKEYDRVLAETEALMRKLYKLDSLRSEVDYLRERIEGAALLAFEGTGNKTVFDQNGYTVTVAIMTTPVIADQAAVFAAIDAAGLGDTLTTRTVVKALFNRWAKTQRNIGAPVPGVAFNEERSVRVTLPKEVPDA